MHADRKHEGFKRVHSYLRHGWESLLRRLQADLVLYVVLAVGFALFASEPLETRARDVTESQKLYIGGASIYTP
jgi:hypothetical protein